MGLFCCTTGCRESGQSASLRLKQEAWGPIVARLLSELPDDLTVPQDLVEKGRVLDNFYVPTRYANGHPSGAPFEHYGPLQSEEAIRYAREIIGFVRDQVA